MSTHQTIIQDQSMGEGRRKSVFVEKETMDRRIIINWICNICHMHSFNSFTILEIITLFDNTTGRLLDSKDMTVLLSFLYVCGGHIHPSTRDIQLICNNKFTSDQVDNANELFQVHVKKRIIPSNPGVHIMNITKELYDNKLISFPSLNQLRVLSSSFCVLYLFTKNYRECNYKLLAVSSLFLFVDKTCIGFVC